MPKLNPNSRPKKHIRFRTILFILFAWLIPLNAQNAQVNATVNKNKIGLNEKFEYRINVSGQSTNLPSPEFPSFDNFIVLSGPNTSTNIQFINGKMSSSKGYSFYLQPSRVGSFEIGAATIEVDGKIIPSNVITIKVAKETGATKQPATKAPKSITDAEIAGENLFLKAKVDKKSVYQNEQIVVTYNLYFLVDVRSYNIDKIPSNPGFWMEEFEIPSQPQIENEIVNGVNYRVATLRKLALFPTRSGELTIEPLVVSVDALVKRKRRSRSLFDSFFDDPFGRTVRKTVASKSLSIKVNQLPVANQPTDFDGAIGTYNLEVTTDKTELAMNEAASVKLTISGTGNIKLLSTPQLKSPPDIEVYDPKIKTSISRERDLIRGSKVVEYVIVPRYPGEYEIPAVGMSYFDLSTRSYKILSSAPLNIDVSGDITQKGLVASGSNLSKQEVQLLGQDIRFIMETANFSRAGEKIYSRWTYLMGYILPILGLVFTVVYTRQREKIKADFRLANRRRAGRIASKHLIEAKKALKPSGAGEFYRKMSLALQGFVSNRLNIQMTDFNGPSVYENLSRAGLGEDEINEYQACLEESDFKQYSGSQVDLQEMKLFFEKSRKILTRLEKYI